MFSSSTGLTHPEIHIQIPTAAKLPIADLEGDGHLVVRMQNLVEALPRMRLELDVVRMAHEGAGEQDQEEIEERRHLGQRDRMWYWIVRSLQYTNGMGVVAAVQGGSLLGIARGGSLEGVANAFTSRCTSHHCVVYILMLIPPSDTHMLYIT